MKSKRTKQFRARFDTLPESVQQQANHAYQLFAANPAHSGLDLKQVSKKARRTPLASAFTIAHWQFASLTIGSGSGLAATRNMTSYWINCSSAS